MTWQERPTDQQIISEMAQAARDRGLVNMYKFPVTEHRDDRLKGIRGIKYTFGRLGGPLRPHGRPGKHDNE